MKTGRFWIRIIGLVLGGLGLAALGFYYIQQYQNESGQQEIVRNLARNEQWPALQTSIEKRLQTFDALASSREVTHEALSILKSALTDWNALRKEHPRIYFPGSSELIDQINSRYTQFASEILQNESHTKEQDALALIESEFSTTIDQQDAILLLEQALQKQREINHSYADSPYASYIRESDLLSRIQQLQSLPLSQTLAYHNTNARQHFDLQRWKEAVPHFQKATETQREINHLFPNSTFANLALIIHMEEQIAICEANDLREVSLRHEEQAAVYSDTGNIAMALEELTRAAALQQTINRDYARTPASDIDRSNDLTEQIQTIQASDVIRRIHAMDRDLDLLLSVRMVKELGYKLDDLIAAFSNLSKSYPQAKEVPSHIRVKAEYLQKHASSLQEVFNIIDNTPDAPLAEQTHGLSRSIPSPLINQRLYFLMMGTNPSRQLDDGNPVDSVDLEEVSAFCERLSWLLVQPIRLPTWRELESIEFQNTRIGITREWTSTASPQGDYAIFEHGDHALPMEQSFHPPTERSRTLSFRVVW